ncbi:MAG TPA: hypothetical protein VMI06_01215 [Terriglobia bacterium]|nr:hypothetical protein [Terriglobia bacterium]
MAVPPDALWLPALFVILVGTAVSVRFLRISLASALALGLVKASIPFLYFGYFSNSAWHLMDDIKYYEMGRLLLSKDSNPFLIFFSGGGREQLFSVAGGMHILYYWWNLLALYVFGPYYSSPVFLNVAATFVSAAFMAAMARGIGCSETYAKYLAVFFLLQWDLLAWSSVVNLKDTLVILLTVAAMYFGMQAARQRQLRCLALLAIPLYAVLWIRFYVPMLLLLALLLWAALTLRGWKRISLILFSAAGGLALLHMTSAVPIVKEYLRGDWIYGVVRFTFTPLPWSISPAYSFLTIPTILHDVMVVPAIIAGVVLARRNVWFRFVALYCLVVILFYGHVPIRQGPRERFQVCWILAWGEFECFWQLAHGPLAWRSEYIAPPGESYAPEAQVET